MKERLKQKKGITLIALVITIIVLLILAGVSIAMLTGQNGILTQANNAKIEQSHGAVRDSIALLYNEYQIQINTGSTTKLASTETVTIPAKEEKALANTSMTFLDFLKGGNEQKINYIKEGTDNVLDVEVLTGGSQALGNGTDTDVYKIEEANGAYVVNYYDQNSNPQQIWSIANSTDTGDVTLEPDTGKEALILVYNVSAGDEIELPYDLKWYDEDNEYDATFDFTVDWGDGSTDTITNADIADKATHQYSVTEDVRITITGTFESLSNYYDSENYKTIYRTGYDKLVKVEQWGTTGLKTIDLGDCSNLTQIASPTESSFKDLSYVYFRDLGIQSIPDKMFANCTKITTFEETFYDCNNLQTIGDYAFSGCSNVTSFSSCFSGCDKLTTIGEGIFNGCDNVTSYRNTFNGCANLTGNAPELWLLGTNSEENNYQGNPNGYRCFNGCMKLDNFEKIPVYWVRPPE